MKKLLFYASAVAVLFSSCSKDAVEDVAINTGGHEVFTASIKLEDENKTRLHLEKEGKSYLWDVADAIGVSSKSVLDANIPVTAATAGTSPSFVVSEDDYNRWLDAVTKTTDANPLYVYFPYRPGASFDNDGNIELTIPKEQRYADDSFFRNEVPAVGYAESYNSAGQNIDLVIPVSLLRVNVFGWGELAAIKLEIKDKNGNDLYLSGTDKVCVVPEEDKPYAPALTIKDSSSGADKSVEVSFGMKTAEELGYANTLPVHFVLPAGLPLSEATLTFTPKFKGESDYDESEAFVKTMDQESSEGKLTLRPNLRVTIADNISFGLKGQFLVMDDENYTAEEKFLAYAYLVQNPGTNATGADMTTTIAKHRKTFAKLLGISETDAENMKALLIDSELDFAAYDKAWAKAEYDILDKILYFNELDDFWKDLYTWYQDNGGAIESLKHNAVIGVDGTTIKNLNVVGTGLTCGTSLENITLQNVTVNVGNSNVGGLIAGTNIVRDGTTVNDVVISTGNKVIADGANIIGGIYGLVASDANMFEGAKPIAIDAKNCSAVGRLYGKVMTNIELALEDNFDWDPSVAAFPVIGEAAEMMNVTADIVVNASMLNAGVVGKVNLKDGNSGSVLVADTYYWNGGLASYDDSAYDKDGKVTNPLTPEEFAAMLRLGYDANFVFTHNFDMQGDHSVLDDDVDAMAITSSFVLTPLASNTKTVYTVDGKNKTISNVSWQSTTQAAHAALFGNKAEINDITVTGLTINAEAANVGYVAGLAVTGKANNVTVNNVAINVGGETWKNSTVDHCIGAVFATVNANDIENVTVNNVAIASDAKASAGLVAGKLELSGEISKLKKVVVTGTNTVAVKDVKSMTVKTAAKLESYNLSTNYAYRAPFGIVQPLDAVFSVGGQVNHVLTVENCSYGDKLAAGYWIDLPNAKSVAPSKTAYPSSGYGYVFASNANAGDSEAYNNIAFTK